MRWLRRLIDGIDWQNWAINFGLVSGAGAIVWGVSDIHCGAAKIVFGAIVLAATIIGGTR